MSWAPGLRGVPGRPLQHAGLGPHRITSCQPPTRRPEAPAHLSVGTAAAGGLESRAPASLALSALITPSSGAASLGGSAGWSGGASAGSPAGTRSSSKARVEARGSLGRAAIANGVAESRPHAGVSGPVELHSAGCSKLGWWQGQAQDEGQFTQQFEPPQKPRTLPGRVGPAFSDLLALARRAHSGKQFQGRCFGPGPPILFSEVIGLSGGQNFVIRPPA